MGESLDISLSSPTLLFYNCTVYIVLYITLVLYLLNLLLKKGKREGGKGEEGRSGRGEGGGGEMVAKLTYPLVRAKSCMAT